MEAINFANQHFYIQYFEWKLLVQSGSKRRRGLNRAYTHLDIFSYKHNIADINKARSKEEKNAHWNLN